MILRKLAEAITEQNWFTVVLEVLIVVVGIFIGLQVDDWNEHRKNLQQEAVYLELLKSDVTSMLADLSEHSAETKQRRDTMSAALGALEACDTSEEAQDAVKFALERYQVLPPVLYLGATYNEMVATGALARIADIELKQSIANAFSLLGNVNNMNDRFRDSMTIVDEIIWQNMSYSTAGESGRLAANFDIAELCPKPEVRNAFAEMIDIQRDTLSTDRRALSQAEPLLELLSANSADTP